VVSSLYRVISSTNYSVFNIMSNNSCCSSYASYLAKSAPVSGTVHSKQGMWSNQPFCVQLRQMCVDFKNSFTSKQNENSVVGVVAYLIRVSLESYSWVCWWKYFENWSASGKVRVKSKQVPFCSGHSVNFFPALISVFKVNCYSPTKRKKFLLLLHYAECSIQSLQVNVFYMIMSLDLS